MGWSTDVPPVPSAPLTFVSVNYTAYALLLLTLYFILHFENDRSAYQVVFLLD